MPNPIVHFEILAGANGDKAALQQFYRDAFDWDIQVMEPMNYGMVPAPEGRGIGGAVDQVQDGGPMTVVYIEVDDPRAALERAQGRGAEVLMDVTDIPGQVTIAQFRDPAGNVVGIVGSQPPGD